jgi:hypothetical protein
MDLNDPRRRLQLAQQASPSIRLASVKTAVPTTPQITTPAPQPQTIRLAQPTPQPSAPTVQKFKGFTTNNTQSKKLFGVDVGKFMGSYGKTSTIQANQDIDLDPTEFLKRFDSIENAGGTRKAYVADLQKRAPTDAVAAGTLDLLQKSGRFGGGASDLLEGANDKLYGGLSRGALRAADFVLPGKNTLGLEAMANTVDGPAQYTKTGKVGEKIGSTEKGIVDVASLIAGTGLAEQGASKIPTFASATSKLSKGSAAEKVAAKVLSTLPGSSAGTGISSLQTAGKGDEQNLAKDAGIGLAADLALPLVGKLGGKFLQGSRMKKAGVDKGTLGFLSNEKDPGLLQNVLEGLGHAPETAQQMAASISKTTDKQAILKFLLNPSPAQDAATVGAVGTALAGGVVKSARDDAADLATKTGTQAAKDIVEQDLPRRELNIEYGKPTQYTPEQQAEIQRRLENGLDVRTGQPYQAEAISSVRPANDADLDKLTQEALQQAGASKAVTPSAEVAAAKTTPNVTPSMIPEATPNLPHTDPNLQELLTKQLAEAKTPKDVENILNTHAATKTEPEPTTQAAQAEKAVEQLPVQNGTAAASPSTGTNVAEAAVANPTAVSKSVADNADTAAKTLENTNVDNAVQEVLSKLDEASTAATKTAGLYKQQRGAKFAKGAATYDSAGGGLEGYKAKLGSMKGKLKQAGFQPLQVSDETTHALLDAIQAKDIMPGEKLNAQTALLKVLGHVEGNPTPSDIKYIRNTLGDDVADAVQDNVKNAGSTWKDKVAAVAATPKAAMATFDLSAPLRQGGVLGSRFPKEWGKAAAEMVQYFGSPKKFEKSMSEIKARPNYQTYQKMKLSVDAAENTSGTEEAFMSSLLETDAAKKILIGHGVAASDRAYSGFLTKLRADVADNILAKTKQAGIELDDDGLKALGEFINSASGRGNLGSLEKHAGLLSKALFSPRLWKSRLDVLNPVYYAKLDPTARKYALQSSASFASIAGTVLAVAATVPGVDVGWDPRSADFAKIKIGNTRYDILGGLQQNIRVGAQLVSGQKINSSTGELDTLGDGFTAKTRKDILYDFFENKENPLIGYATKLLEGKDGGGNPINPATEGAKLLIPLNIQSTYETAKDTGSLPEAAALNAPGIFGAGVQTYGNVASKDKGPNGEWKGKVTDDMPLDNNGKPFLNDKGQPVKVKFDAGATALEKKAALDNKRESLLANQYKSKLSKEDQALLKRSKDELRKYVEDGTITQERYNKLQGYEKDLKNIGKADDAAKAVPEGITSDTAKAFYKKYQSMDAKAQKAYLDAAPDETAKKVAATLNSQRAEGLSEIKPSNKLSQLYADYEKDLNTHPDYTDIDKRNKVKEFQIKAYKTSYSAKQNDIFAEGGSADIKNFIEEGQLDQADLDAAIQMDNELYNSGLTGSLKFSKTFRKNYGYGLPDGGKGGNKDTSVASTGGGRRGSGGRSGGTGEDATVNAKLAALLPSFKKTETTPEFSVTNRRPKFKTANMQLPSGQKKKISINL